MTRLRRALVVALAVAGIASGCSFRRIPGFGANRDGILLVRHDEPTALEIHADDEVLGFAQPGGVTCFREAATGSHRLEARRVAPSGSARPGDLVRANRITLAAQVPLLWDVDHNEILSGRVHERLCERGDS